MSRSRRYWAGCTRLRGSAKKPDRPRLLYASPVSAQATEKAADATAAPTFQATGLHHIALDVTDVPRSNEFYGKHLG